MELIIDTGKTTSLTFTIGYLEGFQLEQTVIGLANSSNGQISII